MPIKIPSTLPAVDVLAQEGVMVMTDAMANRQDIRPLRIALLNLMPKKIQTETQFARLIGATPLQIELSLLRMSAHRSKNTSDKHMEAFYRPIDEVMAAGEKFDGLIVTGAPIEKLPYEEVTYWNELLEVFAWSKTHVHAVMGVCWGAMAMLYAKHHVPKHDLADKAFGCFEHKAMQPSSPYLRGFSDSFTMPVSRWTEIRQEDIDEVAQLELLITSKETGPCYIAERDEHAHYILNHLEYDSDTLAQEYFRDVDTGKTITMPINYFPNDDPAQPPANRWRSHAHLLYGNWINEIYQTTPYSLTAIGS